MYVEPEVDVLLGADVFDVEDAATEMEEEPVADDDVTRLDVELCDAVMIDEEVAWAEDEIEDIAGGVAAGEDD